VVAKFTSAERSTFRPVTDDYNGSKPLVIRYRQANTPGPYCYGVMFDVDKPARGLLDMSQSKPAND